MNNSISNNQQAMASKEDLLAIIANNVRVVPLTESARRKLDAPYDLEQQTWGMVEAIHHPPITHSEIEASCERLTIAGPILVNIATEVRSIAETDDVEDIWIEEAILAANSSLVEFIPTIKADLMALVEWLESKKPEACSEGALTRIEWEDPEAVAEAMKALAALAQTGDNGQSV